MDGIALAAARDYPDLVILLMTGYADQRERAHGLDALIHDVITKPFSLAEIRAAVASALAAAGCRGRLKPASPLRNELVRPGAAGGCIVWRSHARLRQRDSRDC